MGYVDREKHDVDVMERVFASVWADDPTAPRGEVVNLDVRPWFGGLSTPTVEITVNAMDEHQQQPPAPPRADRRQEYESDRRGEHKYPHEEDRPSQRERDELKERLERGR